MNRLRRLLFVIFVVSADTLVVANFAWQYFMWLLPVASVITLVSFLSFCILSDVRP
jgi:hypothetical protein